MTAENIESLVNRRYEHGFVTDIESDTLPPGLSEDVIRAISARKNEPEWLLEWRLKAYNHWLKMEQPDWAHLKIAAIDFQAISYFSAPKSDADRPQSLDEVDPKLLETYDKLGVPLHERARLAGVAVDAVFDSVSVGTTFKKELGKAGVIFCSFSEAVKEARARGYTEPHPAEDLSGMDVARKLLIVAREVGLELELDDIEVESVIPAGFAAGKTAAELPAELTTLNESFSSRISGAAENGEVLRYVGRIEGGKCSVSIVNVKRNNPLSTIRDGENALVLSTRYYQPIPLVLRGYGAGAQVTAAGVFGDLLRTAWRPLDQ